MSNPVFMILIIFVAVIPGMPTAQTCGDSNGDDVINISDVSYLINFIFLEGTFPEPYWTGDTNGDEVVNVVDVSYLINYIFFEGPDPDCALNTVTDIDGNVYQTIKIGNQWWMAENLRVTHYRNGDPIQHVTDYAQWSGLPWGAYCEYGNDPANSDIYGLLYNWFAAADPRNIAPEGWRVATDDDWKELEMYLGLTQSEANDYYWRGTDEGGKLKDTGTVYWNTPNWGATNESGFTGLPGGYRFDNGHYANIRAFAVFWTASESTDTTGWYRILHYYQATIGREDPLKVNGFSIRCVKD